MVILRNLEMFQSAKLCISSRFELSSFFVSSRVLLMSGSGVMGAECEEEGAEHRTLGGSSIAHWYRGSVTANSASLGPACEKLQYLGTECYSVFQVCEDWVGISESGILCGSVGSESILVRVQAVRDVVSDVLESQFLEALHQDGGESCRMVVFKTRHSRLFRYT